MGLATRRLSFLRGLREAEEWRKGFLASVSFASNPSVPDRRISFKHWLSDEGRASRGGDHRGDRAKHSCWKHATDGLALVPRRSPLVSIITGKNSGRGHSVNARLAS